MPLDIPLPGDPEKLSLEEFVERIDSEHYDFSRIEDLIDAARYLKKLGNNKTFLLEKMFDELRTISDFQRSNYYGPQVFLLHTTDRYFIRANVWRPISDVERTIPGFQYDICHDHNFDILSTGYFGPGYVSRCYTYDRRYVVGRLGETVELSPEGLFQLSEGRVALYRAKLDVHIQLPPEDLSVSLNLIPKNDSIRELQFQFDEQSGRICRYLQASGSELVVRLAGVLGDEACLEPLEAIARNHPSAQMRAFAAISRSQISRQPPFVDGQSALVRDIVEKETRTYGACQRRFDAEL